MTYVQYVHFYLKVFRTEKYEDNTEKLLYTSVENAFKLKVTYSVLFRSNKKYTDARKEEVL